MVNNNLEVEIIQHLVKMFRQDFKTKEIYSAGNPNNLEDFKMQLEDFNHKEEYLVDSSKTIINLVIKILIPKANLIHINKKYVK